MAVQAGPGTVLAVWTGTSDVAKAIRIEEVLLGRPAVANHVIGVTHQDAKGRWMGIEGRPGGVGPVDCTPFLSDPRTRGNHGQPLPGGPPVMDAFLASCAKSVGIGYDWAAIAEDGLDALDLHDLAADIDPLWRWPSDHDLLPGHVVCSSLFARLYEMYGWKHPALGAERTCDPAQWWDFSDRRLWA